MVKIETRKVHDVIFRRPLFYVEITDILPSLLSLHFKCRDFFLQLTDNLFFSLSTVHSAQSHQIPSVSAITAVKASTK